MKISGGYDSLYEPQCGEIWVGSSFARQLTVNKLRPFYITLRSVIILTASNVVCGLLQTFVQFIQIAYILFSFKELQPAQQKFRFLE